MSEEWKRKLAAIGCPINVADDAMAFAESVTKSLCIADTEQEQKKSNIQFIVAHAYVKGYLDSNEKMLSLLKNGK